MLSVRLKRSWDLSLHNKKSASFYIFLLKNSPTLVLYSTIHFQNCYCKVSTPVHVNLSSILHEKSYFFYFTLSHF